MSTTDRINNLNSRRTITDRVGQTVVLGNSVEGAALNIPVVAAAAAGGSARASVPFDMAATASLEMENASFGIWAVFWDIDTTALLQANGKSTAAARSIISPVGALTWGAIGSLIGIQVKTATGTYTPTTGTTRVIVELLGGGGGGGGAATTTAAQAAAGGGGGAGAYAVGIITSGFSGVTVTVGAAGAASAAGANNGGTGGTTQFGSVLNAGGGTGGTGDAAAGVPNAASAGVGGAASGSASLFGADGQYGEQGWVTAIILANPGGGGNTLYGAGGQANHVGSGANGSAGTGYGSGGAGGANAASQGTARSGGAGTQGIAIIYEFNS